MMMLKRITTSAFVLLLGSAGGLADHTWAAEPTEVLTPTTFAEYHKQIKPQPGESRWMELPWYIDLHVARQKAAAEGKPLFLYTAGGGSTAIGPC